MGKVGFQTVQVNADTNFAYSAQDGDIVLADATSRSVTDGVTTNGSKAITSATAAFTQADVGKEIGGTGITVGTTIASVQSGTAATLSANATAGGTGVTLTIGGEIDVTLPGTQESVVKVVLTSASGKVVVKAPQGGTVNGASSLTISAQYGARELVTFDGVAWFDLSQPSGPITVANSDAANAPIVGSNASAAGPVLTIGGVSLYKWAGNPNTHVAAHAKGDLCVDTSTPKLWQAGAADNASWA